MQQWTILVVMNDKNCKNKAWSITIFTATE